MGHCKGGPHMSAELADMPLTKDMTSGRPSCIINAGARSRMGGQPQMGHSPAEMGHDSPAEFINPRLAKAIGGAAIKTAKKVGKAVKKVAKKVKEDMTGGFEHARKRREMRGGK